MTIVCQDVAIVKQSVGTSQRFAIGARDLWRPCNGYADKRARPIANRLSAGHCYESVDYCINLMSWMKYCRPCLGRCAQGGACSCEDAAGSRSIKAVLLLGKGWTAWR